MAGNWMRSHMSRVFLTPCLSPRHSSRTTPHPLWPRNTPDSERATDSGGGWPGEGVQRRGGGGSLALLPGVLSPDRIPGRRGGLDDLRALRPHANPWY